MRLGLPGFACVMTGLGCLAMTGCQSPQTVAELRTSLVRTAWTSEVRTRTHVVRLKHLPARLQLINSADPDSNLVLSPSILDSLSMRPGAGHGISFAMEVGPADGADSIGLAGDIVYGNLGGPANPAQALEHYLFGLRDKVWLEADGKKLAMSLYNMENSWGMSQGRFFLITFDAGSLKQGFGTDWADRHWKIVLDDVVPGLGRKKLDLEFPKGEV